MLLLVTDSKIVVYSLILVIFLVMNFSFSTSEMIKLNMTTFLVARSMASNLPPMVYKSKVIIYMWILVIFLVICLSFCTMKIHPVSYSSTRLFKNITTCRSSKVNISNLICINKSLTYLSPCEVKYSLIENYIIWSATQIFGAPIYCCPVLFPWFWHIPAQNSHCMGNVLSSIDDNML